MWGWTRIQPLSWGPYYFGNAHTVRLFNPTIRFKPYTCRIWANLPYLSLSLGTRTSLPNHDSVYGSFDLRDFLTLHVLVCSNILIGKWNINDLRDLLTLHVLVCSNILIFKIEYFNWKMEYFN